MKNEEKMLELSAMHQLMLKRIARLNPNRLPKGVDAHKLEQAYESLKGYVWVLKKVV